MAQKYQNGQLREDIHEIKADVKEANKNISRLYEEQGKFKQILQGNGSEGLTKKVRRHETFMNQAIGRNNFIKYAIGGGWLVTIILLIITLVQWRGL
jgi:hypothetical protein